MQNSSNSVISERFTLKSLKVLQCECRRLYDDKDMKLNKVTFFAFTERGIGSTITPKTTIFNSHSEDLISFQTNRSFVSGITCSDIRRKNMKLKSNVWFRPRYVQIAKKITAFGNDNRRNRLERFTPEMLNALNRFSHCLIVYYLTTTIFYQYRFIRKWSLKKYFPA